MNRWIVLTPFVWACATGGEKSDGEGSEGAVDSADSSDPGTTGSTDSGDEGDVVPPVVATARLLNPMSGAGVAGMDVTDVVDGAMCTTNGQGECALEVAGSASFHLAATDSDHLEHRLFGMTSADDFTTISFVATAQLTDQIYSLLDVSRDASLGTVVVGLDRPNLSPASGASATIDAASELAFVLGATLPEEGNTILRGGNSIVTFVNVPPGPVTVSATGAEGTTCEVAPAREQSSHTVESVAGAVSVVTFICE